MKFTTLGALCTGILLSSTLTTAHAISVSGQGTWESTLQGRDLDGNLVTFEAYYDTALNITWLANSNYANATMDWVAANAWAAGLTLGGYTDWRLPTTTDTGTPGCSFAYTGTDCGYNVDTATSEASHLFYTTLGDLATYDASGNFQVETGLTNTGPFINVEYGNYYWSATECAPCTSGAWFFDVGTGYQGLANKSYINFYAWAVHTGDVGVSAVPVPAAAWLFGSGLLGLVSMSRKRRR